MSNHYHIEVEMPQGQLSRAIQWINQQYAAYANRAHSRVGHLFQGRFKSVLIEEDRHLHELTRYIHLNPMRAGIVEDPADYKWSS
jgi:REP element-mobilizing transposase RayT